MMSGGPIRKNYAFEDAKIIDVAPTVLYLMGLPVPEDMDGRVLTEAIEDEFVTSNPVQFESLDDSDEESMEDVRQGFTDEESEMIARRLQALGYIQ